MRIIRAALSATALTLCFPLAAQAVTQVIPGDGSANSRKLTIYVGDDGRLQAKRGVENSSIDGMFFGSDNGPGANYWHLRVKGDPAENQTFGAYSGGVTTVSNGPVTGNWTPSSPASVQTVMRVNHQGTDLFEVKQTVLYVGFDLSFRVVWEVTNIDPQNRVIPFIFGTSADLYIDSSDSGRGVFIDGARRFVGGTNDQSRTTGGLQEVLSSLLPGEAAPVVIPRWASYEEGRYSLVTSRLQSADDFLNSIDPNEIDNGVGVSFADRRTAATGLAAGQTTRYEVIWQLSRPTPLSASPASVSKELPGSHTVTLSFVDANFTPVPGALIRWSRTGINPTAAQQTVVTDSQGLAEVSWPGTTPGLDSVLAYADLDSDGVQDDGEPTTSASIQWIADNHMAGAPQITAPAGVTPTIQTDPANPEAPIFQFGRSQTAAAGFVDCTFDERSGRLLNLPVAATLQPGAGTISDARLFLLDRTRHDPSDLGSSLPTSALADGTAEQSGNVFSFVVPCVVNGDMWLEFTLTEGEDSETFRIPIGGLQLIDPQGVVHDGERYDAAIAAGATPEAARAASAIAGATARLQRETAGGFVNVLSGDPGITPNINPQTTPASGIFQWDVSPGTYRVLVSAPGCRDAIGGPVVIPPPALDVHVRMDCSVQATATAATTTPATVVPALPGVVLTLADVRPSITGLRMTRRTFRRSTTVTAVTAATPRGSTIAFGLSERANVVFTVKRRTTGRRVGTRCLNSRNAGSSRRACTRWTEFTKFRRVGLSAGARTVAFSGRVGRRTLPVGSYRLEAYARDTTGNTGRIATTSFRVVRR